MDLRGVRYIKQSNNRKIGGQSSRSLDAIYIAIKQSCLDCPLKSVDGVKRGCWAEVERTGMVNMRLEKEAEGMDRRDIGREVAKGIDAAWPNGVPEGQMLRLPVSGDLSTPSALAPVAPAISRWLDRGGSVVWGYTHGWRRTKRSMWGRASVLASVEHIDDVKRARKRGFAAAMVVDAFKNGRKAWVEGDVRVIPCPEQTSGVTCDKCRLCFDDKKLRSRNAIVAFEAHGLTKKRALKVLQEANA